MSHEKFPIYSNIDFHWSMKSYTRFAIYHKQGKPVSAMEKPQEMLITKNLGKNPGNAYNQ